MAKKRDPHHPLKGFAGPISSPGKSGSKTGAVRSKFAAGTKRIKKTGFYGITDEKTRAVVERHVNATIRKVLANRRRASPKADLGDLTGVAESQAKPKRVFGAYKGKFDVGPEFFEPLSPEELKAWGCD